MISYRCDCDSIYVNCKKCPLKSRQVFANFVSRLAHFNGWREVNITVKRHDNCEFVFDSKDDKGDLIE